MALVASQRVIIPLQTEFFALEGVSQLIKTIDRVKENLNKSLAIQGVILTMYDRRNKLSSQVEQEARKHFGSKVYKTVIPRINDTNLNVTIIIEHISEQLNLSTSFSKKFLQLLIHDLLLTTILFTKTPAEVL